MLTAISFNTNSIRQRMHQLQTITETYSPDFIGIQETKVTDEDFPVEQIESLGYHVHFHGQKTHYGVALLSKYPFIKAQKGFEHDTDETQKRLISGHFDTPLGEVKSLTVIFLKAKAVTTPVNFQIKQNFIKIY